PDPRSGVRMPNGFPALSEFAIAGVSNWILQCAYADAPAPPQPSFSRGDANLDGKVDLTDPIAMLGYLFQGVPADLGCKEAGDMNDDGKLHITGPLAGLGYLFLGSPAVLASPFPGCGVDPTGGTLGCERSKC